VIIGKSIIHDGCKIGAGTTIANAEIPPNKTVVGASFRILGEPR
jgi:serine acetyltransferase